MLHQQSLIRPESRSAANSQWSEVQAMRNAANVTERGHFATMRTAGLLATVANQALVANQGIIPQDVYREFDNITVDRFRLDDGDAFLNDILPLSRSVNIGKLTYQYRRASDQGATQTSMTGQLGVNFDQVEFNYDGTIVPIHDNGFFRNWREWSAQQSEGFDALIDDQRESVAAIRRRAADSFLDGHVDNDGNFIVVDNLSWQGMRNDARVAQINLGASGLNFDFTDDTQTGEAIKAAFIQVLDVLRITNKCNKMLTIYISMEIMSNFERNFSAENASNTTILEQLSRLTNVQAIKQTNKLVGNEMMGFPLDAESVRPIVGMGVNTVAMPRPVYNDNYAFVTWAAIGFQVYNDYFGLKCAFFAQDLG